MFHDVVKSKYIEKSTPKMNILELFLIITLIGVNSINVAGESSYIFYHLTTEDGLSNNSVKTILRDSHGFLWIGTEFGLLTLYMLNLLRSIYQKNTQNQ